MNKRMTFVKPVFFLVVTLLIIGSVFLGGPIIAQETRTLTVWDWHSIEVPEVLGELYGRFEQKYNAKVKVTSIAWGDLPNKYMIAAKAGALPDVGEIWAKGFLPEFAEEGWIESLDSYIEREGGKEYLAMYADWAIPRYKDSVYALPVFSGIMGMFWNKTRFAEAGIPGPPKTWQELVDAGMKLTEPDRGLFGLALNGADVSALMYSAAPFIYQNGGRIGKIDGKYRLNSPKSIGGIEFLLDLINKYKIVPSYTTTTAKLIMDLFNSGRVGMMINASWGVPITHPAEDFQWATAVLPKGKTTGSPIAGWDATYGIFKDAKNKDLAWDFVKFVTNEESNLFWISESGAYLSAVNSTREKMAGLPLLAPFMEQASLPNAYDMHPYMPKQLMRALETWKVEMQKTVLGQKTAQKAMDSVLEEWIRLDEEWEKRYGT